MFFLVIKHYITFWGYSHLFLSHINYIMTARIYSKENILDEQKYMEDIFTRIRKGYGQLSDEQLDKIVYSDLFRHHYA